MMSLCKWIYTIKMFRSWKEKHETVFGFFFFFLKAERNYRTSSSNVFTGVSQNRCEDC